MSRRGKSIEIKSRYSSPPYPRGRCSKTPERGSKTPERGLELQIVLIPTHTHGFSYIHILMIKLNL